MTDEIDIMQKALTEYKDAVRMKNMNQELLQHLGDSIFYLIKHSEKYNLPLPKKDELIRMVDRANSLIGQITEPTNRQLTGRNTNREANRARYKELLPYRLILLIFLAVTFG